VLVYLEDKPKSLEQKPKATVMGIQITITKTHTKSERNFFEHWKR
jgi:hypothetical protein